MMGWMPLVGLRGSPREVLVGELVLAGLGVIGAQLVSAYRVRRVPAASARTGEPGTGLNARLQHLGLPSWPDLVGVALPAILTIFIGRRFLGGIARPPGWDAMNHAFLTRRMIQTGSTAIENVCVTGSTHVEPSCSFYPLAADTLWAQTVEVGGSPVGSTMLEWAILVGPLAMVVGVYAAVRLLGGRPAVASVAAAMPALLGPMWISLRSGRVTEQAAPCMAAGVALLVALGLRGRHPLQTGALAAVAAVGIVMSHSYDVLFVATLAVACALVVPERFSFRGLGAGLATMVLTAVVGLLPFWGRILGAGGERGSSDPVYKTVQESFQFWVQDFDRYVLFGFPPPGTRSSLLDVGTIDWALKLTLVAMVASPLAFFLRPVRWARPWVAAGLLWTAIGIWTSYSESPAALALSSLWYGVRERLRNMILPVYGLTAVAGACAIGLVLYWVASRLTGWVASRLTGRLRAEPLTRAHHAASVSAVALLMTLTGLAVPRASWDPLRADLLRRSPVGANFTGTYLWLKEHTRPDAVVAYDRHVEFMTWSYADYGTGLLFGIPPLDRDSKANWAERWRVFYWLVNEPHAEPAGCLVRKYDIEYLAVGMRRVPGWTSHYRQTRLAKSDRVRLVHSDGALRIFEVTDAGRACG
jgi:hypothetical protein